MPNRRDFLQASLSVPIAMGMSAGGDNLRGSAAYAARPQLSRPAQKKMKLLILGGTGFLGPAVVEAAVARGHTMTLFNRGRTNPEMFDGLEKLKGNRDPEKGDGLAALRGRTFDAVIDTSGYYPRMVRASAGMLMGSGQYVFISSISVYADNSIPDMDETGPIGQMEDPTLEEMGDQFQYYGPLKALCEQAAAMAFEGRATSIRPGLIVGPRDNVPRFTYWPVRIEKGGEILSPGTPDDPVQYIDVRDLAEFVIKTVEDRTYGEFNATGPNSATNVAEMLYGCKAVTGGDAAFTWVDADFLAEKNVNGWSHMPVWISPRGDYAGFHRVNCMKAISAGLRTRPLAQTVEATLEWYHDWPEDKPFRWRGGIEPEREAEVLAAWHGRVMENT